MDDKELKKARNIAFRLLKYRVRSEKELINRLGRRKVSGEVIRKVLQELKDFSLVDDEKFTKLWVEDRLKKGYGFLRIKNELKEKGIKEELIKEILEEFKKKTKISSLIEELVKRRIKRYKAKSPLEIKRKLFSYLLARGFFFEEIKEVLERLEINN